MRTLAAVMVARRWLLLLTLGIVTAGLLPTAMSLTYDRSIHSFFDPGHPLLAIYEQVEREFGGDAVCVAVYEDENLLSLEGMQALATIRDRLAGVAGVRGVTSLADLRRPSRAVQPKTILQWFSDGNASAEELAREILDADVYRNQFVGSDGKTTAMLVLLDSARTDSAESRAMFAELRRAIGAPPYRGVIVGAPVLLNDFFDKMEEDAWTLTTVSVATMALVIFALFRNLRWVALPLVIVFSTIVWLRAAVALAGLQLGFTMAMTTSLICVIGIATTIHVAIRFREELQNGGDKASALERALSRVMPAVFWTCATTAIGFGALAVSKVSPVRDFGLAMSAASMLVGVAVVFAIPGGVLIGRMSSTPMAAPGEATLGRGLEEVEHLVTRYSWLSVAAAVGTIAVASLGITWLEVESDFTKNFRGDSPLLDGYRFAEDRLEGAGLLGLSFDAPEKINAEFLDRVRRVEESLRALPGVTKVIGLTDFMDFANKSLPAFLQGDSSLTLGPKLTALKRQMPREIGQVWNEERSRLRLILRVQERKASRDKQALLNRIEAIGVEAFGGNSHATGLYVLMVNLMDSLIADQWRALLISSTGALLSLSTAFRSLRIGLAAFIPNVIPIATVVGFMGWVGLKVNAATAMIQSISMGLAVDFSIHYIYRVLQEVKAGASFHEAMARSHRSTGKAMVFASIALMLGFGVLVFSNFLPTMQFGLLVSLAMAGGVIGNLVLLPVLLTWLTPKRIRERGLPEISIPTAEKLQPVNPAP
jgi:predicted RND superfamily exporter protein